jgi:hypothetical protein
MEEYETIAVYEGMTIEEAKLTYAERKELPSSAFCGPDRTYPAHDAAHVRNAFARLSRFGDKIAPAIRKRIYRCLVRRAKKFGVEHDPSTYKWGKSVSETFEEEEKVDEMIDWLFRERGITKDVEEAFWIQKAIKHRGALREQLGYKEDEKIPTGVLEKIAKAETGSKITVNGKTIEVTTQLRRRAILALRLSKMPRRTD